MSSRIKTGLLISAAALAMLAVAGCYLKPIIVRAGDSDAFLVVGVLEPETNSPSFLIYSSSGGDLTSWREVGDFAGSPTAAEWLDGRLWVFHGSSVSIYTITGDEIGEGDWEPVRLGLEWRVVAAESDGAGNIWCVGIKDGRLAACIVTPNGVVALDRGPATGDEDPVTVDCVWNGDSLLVAWRGPAPGPESVNIETVRLDRDGWSGEHPVTAPPGRIAISHEGASPILLVLARKGGLSGRLLLESSLSDGEWSPFVEAQGTTAEMGFGDFCVSADGSGDEMLVVRTNTQRLQVFARRGGKWRQVASPEGLPEGNMQVYVGALLLLAIAMLLSGIITFVRWIRGSVSPEPPPGWKSLAPISRRGLAYAADLLVLIAPVMLILKAMGLELWTVASRPDLQGMLLLVPFLYFAVSEAAFGATFGKHMMGIRVVMGDGSPVTTPAAVVRNVLRLLDSLPPAELVPVLGLIFVCLTRRRQRLGDLFAETFVVCVEKAARERPDEGNPDA